MHPVFSVSISEPHVLFIYIRLINMSEAVCSSMSLSRSNLYRAVSFDAAFVASFQNKNTKNISHIYYVPVFRKTIFSI